MPPHNVTIISTPDSWIEGSAVQQLEKVAGLPGVCRAVGMPDLHPGRGYPIGAAVVSEGVFYPHLVGNDIGCGMGLWLTAIKAKRFRVERVLKSLGTIDGPWDGDISAWLDARGLAPGESDKSLGTVGRGNHFAEFQRVEEVIDEALFSEAGLDRDRVVLLVHSGSRGLGEYILGNHANVHGTDGVAEDSPAAAQYLEGHAHAARWAAANRALIARRLLDEIGTEGEQILDLCHNSLERIDEDGTARWLHRKGASPSDCGLAVVPGSRGAFSYIVMPTGDQRANAWSLAHGAGRKWNRTAAKERLDKRYTAKALQRTSLGSVVVCDDKNLLYEEAPEAYKDIRRVVDDMVEARLIRVVASLRPLLTYKVRKNDR